MSLYVPNIFAKLHGGEYFVLSPKDHPQEPCEYSEAVEIANIEAHLRLKAMNKAGYLAVRTKEQTLIFVPKESVLYIEARVDRA